MELAAIHLQKSYFRPGEAVQFHLEITAEAEAQARLQVLMYHLAEIVAELNQDVQLKPGTQLSEITWQAPAKAPCGYGLQARLLGQNGQVLSELSAGFDILEHWTQSPRYGFLTDFSPGRKDIPATLDLLARYHLNGLQFYDWLYRHDTLMAEFEPYLDPLGRELSSETVSALVAAAHNHQMAAMPYTAVYAASLDFYRTHPEWGLYTPDGQPIYFFDFLAIMDPRPNSPWVCHLLEQYAQVLAQTGFDGIHIDQYGDPKTGCDSVGQFFDLAGPLAEFIAATRAVVDQHRAAGTVIFNAVGNWPIEAVAPAPQDLVYIEIWPPDNAFGDLHRIITQAQALGNSKPVVLAAYLDPAAETNVRLADAVIFASGASHIELGEPGSGTLGFLSDPYFPKHSPLSPRLAAQILRLYDFSVRYQDVIGPQTLDATPAYQTRLHLSVGGRSLNTVPVAGIDTVWPIVRTTPAYTALNLVNLMDVAHTDWNKPLPVPPQPLSNLRVELSGTNQPVQAVWWASPDTANLQLHPLPFILEGQSLQFEIPALELWNLALIQWENET